MPVLVTTRLVKDRVLAKSAAQRRLLARTVLNVGQKAGLIAFAAPSDRLVMLFGADRSVVSRTCRDTTTALRRRLKLPLPFSRAWFETIDDDDLRSTTKAVLTQWDTDPYREASNLPDLLGARFIGRYTIANANHLLLRRDLLSWWGLRRIQDGTDFSLLPEAAAAAMGLGQLSGRTAEVVDARRAAIQVGRGLGATHARMAGLLHISERQSKRLGQQQVDPALLKAVELQLGLRQDALSDATERPLVGLEDYLRRSGGDPESPLAL